MKKIFFFKKIVLHHYMHLEHEVLRRQDLAQQTFTSELDRAIQLVLTRQEKETLQSTVPLNVSSLRVSPSYKSPYKI